MARKLRWMVHRLANTSGRFYHDRSMARNPLGECENNIMICLAVTYVMKPGTEEEVVERLRQLTEATRLEPGCRFYLTHRSPTEPRKFFLYEQYDDQVALDFHRSTPHFIEHVVGGLMLHAESRTPEIYRALTD